MNSNRRQFIKDATKMSSLALLPVVSQQNTFVNPDKFLAPRIKFSVIGINHAHIYGMVDAVTRGGGELVAFHAKENDLAADFIKKYPTVKRADTEKEILEDATIQLIMSSRIANERAPLGVQVMKHGKDY